MTVYVDNAAYEYRHRGRRMIMCHMGADTLEELHAMAVAIGVDRRHFQKPGSRPHYDICRAKRALAVERGAVEVTQKQMVLVVRRLAASCEVQDNV